MHTTCQFCQEEFETPLTFAAPPEYCCYDHRRAAEILDSLFPDGDARKWADELDGPDHPHIERALRVVRYLFRAA